MIVNVLLITAGVYFGIRAFYTIGIAWLEPGEMPQTYSNKMTFKQQEDHPPLSRYSAITNRNLFNTNPDVEVPAQAIDVDNLKETGIMHHSQLYDLYSGEKPAMFKNALVVPPYRFYWLQTR